MKKIALFSVLLATWLVYDNHSSEASPCTCWDWGRSGSKCHGYDENFQGDRNACMASCRKIVGDSAMIFESGYGCSKNKATPFWTSLPKPGGPVPGYILEKRLALVDR